MCDPKLDSDSNCCILSSETQYAGLIFLSFIYFFDLVAGYVNINDKYLYIDRLQKSDRICDFAYVTQLHITEDICCHLCCTNDPLKRACIFVCTNELLDDEYHTVTESAPSVSSLRLLRKQQIQIAELQTSFWSDQAGVRAYCQPVFNYTLSPL